MDNLPYEILEKIVSNLNFGTVIRVCRKWRDIAERSKKKFKELSVDLAKVEDPNDLIDFKPSILNVTCSMFDETYIKSNYKRYNKKNRLIKVFKTILQLEKIEKLYIFKMKLFLFNTNEEVKRFIDSMDYRSLLNTIIIKQLLKIKIKKIYVKINDDNLKFLLFYHFKKNNITKFIKYFKKIIHIKFIIRFYILYHNKFNFDIFIFDALYGNYSIYDAKNNTLIYRIGNYIKYNIIDEILNNSIIEPLYLEEKDCLHIFIDNFRSGIFEITFRCDKIHIYSINIDECILNNSYKSIVYCKEKKYFYFGNIEKVIFPFELEIKDEIFTDFVDQLDSITLDEKNFEKYNLENMILNL